MGSRVLRHGTILYRMQRLVQARIVTKAPKWMAVVEAFPPLPTPAVTGRKTKKIVYEKDEQKERSKLLQESDKQKPEVLSLFEAYNIDTMPESNFILGDKGDHAIEEDDDMTSSAVEEVAPKAEQLDTDMLQMLDDLKRFTKRSKLKEKDTIP